MLAIFRVTVSGASAVNSGATYFGCIIRFSRRRTQSAIRFLNFRANVVEDVLILCDRVPYDMDITEHTVVELFDHSHYLDHGPNACLTIPHLYNWPFISMKEKIII